MLRRCILVVLVAFAAAAQSIQVTAAIPQVVQERFSRLSSNNSERAQILRDMLAEVGCKDDRYEELKVRGSKLPNLSCTLKGASDRTIIVSAHYDNAGPGEGAIDNWSGASLIPSLVESMLHVNRHLTFRFLLFTDEEKGLVGSRDFVNHLSKEQIAETAADINIDSIGLPAINIWASVADPKLLKATRIVANALKLQLQGVSVDQVGDSDSHPFRLKKIPAIDFHSLTQATITILHSKRDVRTELDTKTYYDTYRLIAFLLKYLDDTEGGP